MESKSEPIHADKVSGAQRSFAICKDHQNAEWNQPTLDDGSCILCQLFYLEAQESLLEEWQQRAERAEYTIAEVERPLAAQMARLNATVARLNDENERLQRLADTRSAGVSINDEGLRGCACTFDKDHRIVDECVYHINARWKAVEAGVASAHSAITSISDQDGAYIAMLRESPSARFHRVADRYEQLVVQPSATPAVRAALLVLLNHVEPGWDNCRATVQMWLDGNAEDKS